MEIRRLFIIGFLVVLVGCAHATKLGTEMTSTYAPVEASLTHINQKVASHFIRDIPDTFNTDQYVGTINEVCRSNPQCLSETKTILDSYGVKVRKVDDMFSVMLCDKDMKRKIMEDFSCNNLTVEIKTWKTGIQEPCAFESNWQRVRQDYCGQ